MNTQISKPIIRVTLGAPKNKKVLALIGTTTSFNKSFKPSAKACSNPQNPVTLGPLRR